MAKKQNHQPPAETLPLDDWACPSCGARVSHVIRTIRNPNSTITRYRECAICEGWSFRTDQAPELFEAEPCTPGKNVNASAVSS